MSPPMFCIIGEFNHNLLLVACIFGLTSDYTDLDIITFVMLSSKKRGLKKINLYKLK